VTTQYASSDSLPRDAGGAKSIALTNVALSQLDYALLGGIGPQVASSKIYAAMRVGTHVGGSKIENPSVGVALMAHFASNASILGVQQAIHVRGDDRGQIFTSSLSATTSAMSGSTETFTTTSGLLYKVYCAGCGVVAAGQIAILNGATSLAHLVFSGANESLPVLDFGDAGTCFASLRYERRNTVGQVWISALYRNYGQG